MYTPYLRAPYILPTIPVQDSTHKPTVSNTSWKTALHTSTHANNTTYTLAIYGKARFRLWRTSGSRYCLARQSREHQQQQCTKTYFQCNDVGPCETFCTFVHRSPTPLPFLHYPSTWWRAKWEGTRITDTSDRTPEEAESAAVLCIASLLLETEVVGCKMLLKYMKLSFFCKH